MNHFDVHNRTQGKSERTCQWYQEVLSMFRKWLAANGLSRLHPDLLRHTYATSFLLNGGDVFLLK